jgi:hypothetical protein
MRVPLSLASRDHDRIKRELRASAKGYDRIKRVLRRARRHRNKSEGLKYLRSVTDYLRPIAKRVLLGKSRRRELPRPNKA